jgi:hypothetical protein
MLVVGLGAIGCHVVTFAMPLARAGYGSHQSVAEVDEQGTLTDPPKIFT